MKFREACRNSTVIGKAMSNLRMVHIWGWNYRRKFMNILGQFGGPFYKQPSAFKRNDGHVVKVQGNSMNSTNTSGQFRRVWGTIRNWPRKFLDNKN